MILDILRAEPIKGKFISFFHKLKPQALWKMQLE